LVNRFNVWLQDNYNGIVSNASGYALNSSLNSFNSYGGQIGNNINYGVHYLGGIAPAFFGVNFTINKTSIALSPGVLADGTPFAHGMVTVGALISGCYFEEDTGSTIVIGGGTGIVRGLIIDGGNIITSPAANPAILIQNYVDTQSAPMRGRVNASINLKGRATTINQSSSAGKIDFQNLNGMNIGDNTPPTLVASKQFYSGLFNKSASPGKSVDLMSVGSHGAVLSVALTITSTSNGRVTTKKYFATLIGGGTAKATALSEVAHDDYGTASPFTLTETANSPTSGINKLTITNNDSVTSTYRIVYTVEDITGTLSLM
jgi:hypothetical protein